MRINNGRPRFVGMWLVSVFVLLLCRIDTVQAFTPGKTYDSKNWQEVEDIAPPFLLNWVKKGEFILATGELDFDFKLEKDFLRASDENLGQFGINEDGLIVDKESRRQPEFIYGLPFPRINAQDPDAGGMIMSNSRYARWRMGGLISPCRIINIGKVGLEFERVMVYKRLFYQGRPGGPIHNPDNFSYQVVMNVVAPMDMKDVVMMIWRYNDHRLDASFTYISALRRFQRNSPSERSEQQLGSDLSKDDGEVWSGKNSTFNWRLIGEKKVLCAFTSPDRIIAKDMSDGTIKCEFLPKNLGHKDTDSKGASWAPVNVTWSPRPVWVVEGVPKDPNYNYGKQLFYVDQATFTSWFKEMYDRSGEYCKTIFGIQSFQISPSERTNLLKLDAYMGIDDRKKHASYNEEIVEAGGFKNVLYCPKAVLGPRDFNLNTVQQLSK